MDIEDGEGHRMIWGVMWWQVVFERSSYWKSFHEEKEEIYMISTLQYTKNVLEKSALLTVEAILTYIDIPQRVSVS